MLGVQRINEKKAELMTPVGDGRFLNLNFPPFDGRIYWALGVRGRFPYLCRAFWFAHIFEREDQIRGEWVLPPHLVGKFRPIWWCDRD